MNFLKNVLAVVIGLGIFAFIGIFIFTIFIGFAVSSVDEIEQIDENSVLVLNMENNFSELGDENPLDFLDDKRNYSKKGIIYWNDAIKNAKNDEKISGIKIVGSVSSTGISSLSFLQRSLEDFKTSGKFVYAYANSFSESGYFFSSVADKVFISPTGNIDFNGLSVSVNYYKRLLEKLKVKAQIFKVGDFKSAVEPYFLDKMSDENRLQLEQITQKINNHIIEKISQNRSISKEDLMNIQENMLIRTAEQALYKKFVDKIAYEDDLNQSIAEKLSIEKIADINFVSIDKYSNSFEINKSGKKIAVIIADGVLMGNHNDNGVIGGKDTAKLIRKARENEKVKAIVLRVNSPGGGLTTSDLIWKEVNKTKGVKPIIVSMSDVAASGGYYISMSSDAIFAEPSTITGSIGIFGVLLSFQGLKEEYLKVDRSYVSTNKFSDIWTVNRNLTDEERSIIQESVDYGYETFTKKAASGRNMPIEKLLKVASGRIWTGQQALDNGLIDKLGGLDEAIAYAVEKAGVEKYHITYYPKKKEIFEKIISSFEDNLRARLMTAEMRYAQNYFSDLIQLEQFQGINARMPYSLKFE